MNIIILYTYSNLFRLHEGISSGSRLQLKWHSEVEIFCKTHTEVRLIIQAYSDIFI